jgi:7-cyano-7-deazaguanine synthase
VEKQGEKAVVLLSGGLDSAVALWMSRTKWQCTTMKVNYYQRHQREIEAASTLAKMAGIENHIVINMDFLKEVADTDLIPNVSVSFDLRSRHPTYVPARNIKLYGAAASLAETTGARWIDGGHTKDDTSLFPDSTRDFFDAMNEAIKRGTWEGRERGLQILTPLSDMSKVDVVHKGSELGVPFEFTYTCYVGKKMACGKCEACQARLRAFEEAGMKDPAEYE